MLTRDKMTRDIFTVEPKAKLDEIYKVMQAMGIRHLPVVEGRRLVGILSDRDILLWSTIRGEETLVPHIPVGDVMTRDVAVTHEMAPIEMVAAKLLEHKIDCLPVVKGEELIGIVTTSDLLELLSRSESPKLKQVIPIAFRLKPLRQDDGPATA
jgi:acetoin utilization protein AcuB